MEIVVLNNALLIFIGRGGHFMNKTATHCEDRMKLLESKGFIEYTKREEL